MTRSLEHLFTPLRIRNVEIRNRILSTGHQTYLAKDGVPSPEMVAYHEGRARGGAGLIVTESSRMHASGMSDAPEKLDIDVRLRTKVDRALVEMLVPDEIIVATGAKPYEPPVEGREDGHVVGAWNLLAGGANLGSSVLVADWRADWIGMGIAEMLALAGHKVQLAVNAPHAGYNLQLYLRDYWMAKLDNLGITVIPHARIYGVDGTTAYLVHALSGSAVIREDVDTVVLATGHTPVTTLETQLNGLERPVHLAGDCLSPRMVEEALYEGFLIGRSI